MQVAVVAEHEAVQHQLAQLHMVVVQVMQVMQVTLLQILAEAEVEVDIPVLLHIQEATEVLE
jgi:hypothetical protein